jgi:hypothetical protein
MLDSRTNLCPEICPRLHRNVPNGTRIGGQPRHGSAETDLLGAILSPETGVRIPVAVLLVEVLCEAKSPGLPGLFSFFGGAIRQQSCCRGAGANPVRAVSSRAGAGFAGDGNSGNSSAAAVGQGRPAAGFQVFRDSLVRNGCGFDWERVACADRSELRAESIPFATPRGERGDTYEHHAAAGGVVFDV